MIRRAASGAVLLTVAAALTLSSTAAAGSPTLEEEEEVLVSRLGLTYNQDCAPDDTNTWRIRPVDVKQAVDWKLVDAPGEYTGTMNPGEGEFRIEAPRGSTTAKLMYDSDGNGSLDKQTVKAAGPDLTFETHPETCAPPVPPSRLGLTYNQDCAPDEFNTWRVRPVEVNASVKWELFQNNVSIGTGVLNPGDGESVVEVPRLQPSTAILRYDSDEDDSLDKQTVKASGPDLTIANSAEACTPPQPDPEVVSTEWVDETVACDDTTVEQTRTTTTTPYVLVDDESPLGASWVLDTANAAVEVETRTRDLTEEEIVPCEEPGGVVLPGAGESTTTTTPPTTIPPTTVAPTTDAPTTVAPTTDAPTTAPDPITVQLPATGSSSSATAAFAALLTLVGVAVLVVSRRRDASTS